MSVDLSGLKAGVADFAEQVWEGGAAKILAAAEEVANVNTGAMRDSGSTSLLAAGESEVVGEIRFDADYSSFVDEGTAPHQIDGNPLLSFNWGGQQVVVRSVQHPGYAGSHWFTDTVTDDNWAEALQGTADSVEVTV